MSNQNESLRKNFLKISIFNLEQTVKQQAANRVKEIDKIESDMQKIEQNDKQKIFVNLQKIKFYLRLIRTNEKQLFNYIEEVYKNGSPKAKSKTTTIKKTKTPRKKKTE